MDASIASLFLYLLFPVINERQAEFVAELRSEAIQQDSSERYSELETYLSSYVSDSDAGGDEAPEEEESAAPDGDTSVSRILLSDSLGRIKLYQYEGELLSVNETADGSFSDVSVNADEFIRTKYDENYRTIERIVWARGATVAESAMKSKTIWTYDADGAFCGIEDYEGGKYTAVFYNAQNLPVETQEYELISGSAAEGTPKGESGEPLRDGTEEGKRVLVRETFTGYDSEGRIISDEEIRYDSPAAERTPTYERRTLYEYTEKSKNADTTLYENGRLRFSSVYENDSDYTETIYFSDTVYVTTRYENGVQTGVTIHNSENRRRQRAAPPA